MSQFIITGGKKLSGEIEAYANKNSVLPILAATLLTPQACVIKNVPRIRDVTFMAEILRFLGSEVSYINETTLRIKTNDLTHTELPKELVRKIRASVLLLGAILPNTGKVSLCHPGGDVIGRRSIETHLSAFSQMGVVVSRDDDMYTLTASNLANASIFLDEASVTATENILLAAAKTPGTTTIKHAAAEPHVQELCKVLNKMGATVKGIGTNVLEISGEKALGSFEHVIEPDHIEVGTWAVLAGVTGGNITIRNVNPNFLEMIVLVLRRFGMTLRLEEVSGQSGENNFILHAQGGNLRALAKVDASPWPGFPTDLISVIIVLATQAEGTTLVRDWMFEGRMFFIDKLITMGANVVLCDPHRVVVSGPSQLYGKQLESPDLRAGMGLVLAALAAQGKSSIAHVEWIERGYANIEERLLKLGAQIKRIED